MVQVDLAPEAKGFRLTGWHVLTIVVGFFTIVMTVDIGMAAMAYRTFSGEVAADPYEAGRLYNRTLAERRVQAALGWTAEIVRLDSGGLEVVVKTRDGAMVDGLTVSALLERPATETGKQTLAFKRTAPGRYQAEAGQWDGAWDVRVRAVDARNRLFEAEKRFVW